jgi:hypothetical protein
MNLCYVLIYDIETSIVENQLKLFAFFDNEDDYSIKIKN